MTVCEKRSKFAGNPLTTIPTIPIKVGTNQAGMEADYSLKPKLTHVNVSTIRKPSDIRIVRNRMYYSKPSFTSKGNVKLGMHPIRKSSMLIY